MAGKAKDIAAAASYCISITAALIGLLLIFSRAIFRGKLETYDRQFSF